MFSTFRTKLYNLITKPYLYERIVFTTTLSGTIIGGISGANQYASTPQTIIYNSVIGSMMGGGIGAFTGTFSPILVPITVLGGAIGIANYGYKTIVNQINSSNAKINNTNEMLDIHITQETAVR